MYNDWSLWISNSINPLPQNFVMWHESQWWSYKVWQHFFLKLRLLRKFYGSRKDQLRIDDILSIDDCLSFLASCPNIGYLLIIEIIILFFVGLRQEMHIQTLISGGTVIKVVTVLQKFLCYTSCYIDI